MHKAQDSIEASQALTPAEQLQLSGALTQPLCCRHVQGTSEQLPRVDYLNALNRVRPVTDLDLLVADFWSDDESANDLNEFVRQQRKAERFSKWHYAAHA